MSLDLPKVLPQVKQMGEAIAQHRAALEKLLPSAGQELGRIAGADRRELLSKIARAGDRWSGAIPTEERCDQSFPPPPHPGRLNVYGADGSQIFPDRHSSALYYLINIASLHIEHGSGQPPVIHSQPDLGYLEDDLYTDEGFRVDNTIISGRRDVAEMGELARLAQSCSGKPALCVLDNSLLLWLALQMRDQKMHEAERLLKAYLGHLSTIKESQSALAGFIDRPNSANVLSLLHLSKLPIERINNAELRDNPYHGLTDRLLFADRLPEGHRSARFTYASPLNATFREGGHEVQFFYLNSGGPAQIVRVEIPTWVAEMPEMLDWVHSGLIEECRNTGGYPYVLARAHEMAVVGQAERQAFEAMLAHELAAHGLSPRLSQKAVTKRWTGRRKSHRL